MSNEQLDRVTDGLKSLLASFRGGGVPEARVDADLAPLPGLTQRELLNVAKALNADATLSEKSPKKKIVKQVSEMVRRVWKTSDNVNN